MSLSFNNYQHKAIFVSLLSNPHPISHWTILKQKERYFDQFLRGIFKEGNVAFWQQNGGAIWNPSWGTNPTPISRLIFLSGARIYFEGPQFPYQQNTDYGLNYRQLEMRPWLQVKRPGLRVHSALPFANYITYKLCKQHLTSLNFYLQKGTSWDFGWIK